MTKLRCVEAFILVVTSILLLIFLVSSDCSSLTCDKHRLNWRSLASEHESWKLELSQLVEDNSYRRNQQASVSLSLHYMDQASWGARRLRSLQCWASQLDRTMRVVEPSMNNTYFGAPVMNPVDGITKFRDVFDIDVWNQFGTQGGYDSLVGWDEFSKGAPRATILVQIIYKKDKWCVDPSSQTSNCTFSELKQYWTDTLKQFSFFIVREVCIDFRDVNILPMEEFSKLIFGDIQKDSPVTIVFNEWRGPLREKRPVENNCILRIRDPVCSPSGPTGLMRNMTLNALRPTPEILHLAKVYADKYLNRTSKYLAVVVRWELMFLESLYHGTQWRYSSPQNCIKVIKEYVHGLGMNTTFLATDAGRYGSRTMQANYTVHGKSYYQRSLNLTEQLLDVLVGRPITITQHDEQFENIMGTFVHPTYHIPQLQKAIAAKAECLLLVGSGSFHESTLALYKSLHDEEEECYEYLQFC